MTARPPVIAGPPTPAQRTRALWQGVAWVSGSVAGFVLVALAYGKNVFNGSLLVTLTLLGATVGTLIGVALLSAARNRKWDARGLIAGALLLLGYPLLVLFGMWTAIGIYVTITGQSILPYSR